MRDRSFRTVRQKVQCQALEEIVPDYENRVTSHQRRVLKIEGIALAETNGVSLCGSQIPGRLGRGESHGPCRKVVVKERSIVT